MTLYDNPIEAHVAFLQDGLKGVDLIKFLCGYSRPIAFSVASAERPLGIALVIKAVSLKKQHVGCSTLLYCMLDSDVAVKLIEM